MSCKHCDESVAVDDRPNLLDTDCGDYGIQIYLDLGLRSITIQYATGDTDDVKIAYCPVCGRKLKEVAE